MTMEFLTLPDRRLAYQRLYAAADRPQLVFLGGYASDMAGTKAQYLAERCAAAGYGLLRFDYRGHGASTGTFSDCTLGDWLADTETMLDRLTTGPQIIVGSSLGGWLGLLLARDRPRRVRALGIAAAPDFTEDLIWDRLSEAQRAAVLAQGGVREGDGDAGMVTLRAIEEARRHLVLRQPLLVACPIRLLQGMRDDQVPWETALRIARHAASPDICVNLIKDGDHRLNRPQDLAAVWTAVTELTGP